MGAGRELESQALAAHHDALHVVGDLLHLPHQAVLTHAHGALVAAGYAELRPAHLGVFRHIEDPPLGSRVTDLAGRMHVTRQSIGELVQHLVRHGYLERLPDPRDRRARRVRLTARGLAARAAAVRSITDLQQAWTRRLGPAKVAQLRDLLEELVAGLGADLDALRGRHPPPPPPDP